MKRSPLARRTPLHSRTPLVRHTPLAAVKAEPKPPRRVRVPDDIRTKLGIRSGRRCEIGLPYCLGEASELHHRVSRKMGGRHGAARGRSDRLANALHVCPVCHAWVTTRPAVAAQHGWVVREHEDPAQVPVWYRRQSLVWLDDEGQVHDYEAGAA